MARRGWTRRALVVAALLPLAYVAVTFALVWRTAHTDGRDHGDAIVVLGAAQYDGRPSPVLRARLDHVISLYRSGTAGTVVVTGGNRPGDRFTEASASARYLTAAGVPSDAIVWVTTGASTYESLAATQRVLRGSALGRVVLVSDPHHLERLGAIADELGLTAGVSAATDSAFTGPAAMRALWRETLLVAAGRVVGFRRLDAIARGTDNTERTAIR